MGSISIPKWRRHGGIPAPLGSAYGYTHALEGPKRVGISLYIAHLKAKTEPISEVHAFI
jgi:hypothetical protein